MASCVDTVCANSALIECRMESVSLWATEPIEIFENAQIRLRTVVWGVTLSAFLWSLLILSGRALWLAWR